MVTASAGRRLFIPSEFIRKNRGRGLLCQPRQFWYNYNQQARRMDSSIVSAGFLR